jgi:hypothetical protein
MLTTKRQILAVTAAIAAIVMTAGTGVAELMAKQSHAAHPAQVAQPVAQPQPPIAPAEDGEST